MSAVMPVVLTPSKADAKGGGDAVDAVGTPHPLPSSPFSWWSLSLEQKWFRQFFIGILICVNNGACFTFGIFSPFMKKGGFRYTQTQVNIVSTVGVFLSYFSVPNGYLYDTRGPQATLLAGTILNVTGWAGMFLLFVNMERPLLSNSIVVVSFFYALSQFSASFYETGSVLTNLRSFSCYKGRVVLIQKTFMGLGSALVAQVYVAFFERTFSTVAPFFLFLAVFSAVAGVLSVRYVRLPGPGTWCLGLNVPDLATLARGGGESAMFDRPFNVGTVILIFAVAFVLFVSLLENFVPELSTVVRALIGVVTVSLVTSFASMIVVAPSYLENVGGFHESTSDAAMRTELLSGDSVFSPTTAAMEGVTIAPVAKEAAVSPIRMAAESPRNASSTSRGSEEDLTAAQGRATQAPVAGKATSYGGFDMPSVTSTVEAASDIAPVDGVSLQKEHATGVAIVEADESTSVVVQGPTRSAPAIQLNEAPLLTNLRHPDIWLLWYICFASWGAMTLISSNSSQIYQAVAYEDFSLTVNTVFVSIYGVASAAGRILVGAGQPIMERRRIPISLFLIVAPCLNVLGVPLFLTTSSRGLFVPFFLVGFATGVSWGSTVLVVTAFFVITNAGKHYSWLYTAGMLSPLVFNIALFGPVYGKHSRLQGREEDHSCKGAVCVRLPLLVCILVNAAAIPCAYLFMRRTCKHGGVRA